MRFFRKPKKLIEPAWLEKYRVHIEAALVKLELETAENTINQLRKIK